MNIDNKSADILILIKDTGNYQVLKEWLREKDRFNIVLPSEDIASKEFDLCVLDRQGLIENEELLRDRKYDRGYIPYLLVLPESIASKTVEYLPNDIDKIVDDILQTPLRPMALSKRINMALQVSKQAGHLSETNKRLRIINRITRHDIRNDMAVIQGWAKELRPHLNEKGIPMLENVIAGSEHVVGLTESLRDVIQTFDRDNRNYVSIDLHEQLGEVINRRREVHSHAQIEYNPGSVHPTIRADELLTSVFRNLIDNAVEHNPKDTPRVWIQTDVKKARASVTVADDGPGIPPEHREAVRGRAEGGLDHPAAGLGLYLVDTLVTDYGGTMQIANREEGGTSVCVTLPVIEPERDKTTKQSEVPTHQHRRTQRSDADSDDGGPEQ